MTYRCFCGSLDLDIAYDLAKESRKKGKWRIPVRCRSCNLRFYITKHGQYSDKETIRNKYRERVD